MGAREEFPHTPLRVVAAPVRLSDRLLAFLARWTSPVQWARARKYLVALMGVAAQLLAAGVIPDPWASRVQLVLALATALGVYGVANARVPAPEEAGDPA